MKTVDAARPQKALASFARTSFVKTWMVIIAVLFAGGAASAEVVFLNYSSTDVMGTGAQTVQTLQTLDLPGTNDLTILKFTFTDGVAGKANYFQLYVGGVGGGGIATAVDATSLYFARSLNVGQTWANLGGGSVTTWADISRLYQDGSSSNGHLRTDPTYVPFNFVDSTDLNLTKYGYVSLDTYATGSGASAQLTLNIHGYAYENSGAQIQMGAIPEASTYAMIGAGLLGLLATRRQRA
ncbi:MAG: PEP-CTERM sorting domain-containing protein [Verrucomicrobiia bacterium]